MDHEHCDEKEQVEGGLGQLQSQEYGLFPYENIPSSLRPRRTPQSVSQLCDHAITKMALLASPNTERQKYTLEQWQMRVCKKI